MSDSVCVINRDPCMYRFTALPQGYKPNPKKPDEVTTGALDELRLWPGVNFLSLEDYERFGLDSHPWGDRVVQAEVERMPEYSARELVAFTTVPALKQWLSFEERPSVRAAIEERLAKRGVRN